MLLTAAAVVYLTVAQNPSGSLCEDIHDPSLQSHHADHFGSPPIHEENTQSRAMGDSNLACVLPIRTRPTMPSSASLDLQTEDVFRRGVDLPNSRPGYAWRFVPCHSCMANPMEGANTTLDDKTKSRGGLWQQTYVRDHGPRAVTMH